MPYSTTNKLIHDMQALVQHAEDLVAATTDSASDVVADARSQAEKSLHAARKALHKIEHSVVAEAKHVAKETDDYVHENPWLAMGAAASAGVLVGLLLARR
jgi:ElaB/YqjD/DUF883 family membrane-anchored ribosome-binding protein